MDQFFSDLGRRVLATWKAQNFSPDAFPEIARSALQAKPPAEHVDLAALIEDFLFHDEQPLQTHSGFGQPELIVFEDPRFYIQLLFWLDGTTDIHQHTFSGAFHVLAGSSIQSRFEFEDAESITAHLRVGNLRLTETRLLEAGSTVPIVAGPTHIHSLFHLETPSLTVVIRTQTDPGSGPQFTYLPPHLAVDPFHEDALTTRRKQLLDVLEQTADPSYAEVVRAMISALDFERGFFILQNARGALRELGAWEETWQIFAAKHCRLAAFVAPTLEEIVRRDQLAEMRRMIIEPEHRFFLALLLNVSRRDDLLRLVSERFPGCAAETILRWAGELCESDGLNASLLDAHFPADLDVAAEHQATALIAALGTCFPEFQGSGAPSQWSAPSLARLREVILSSSLRPLAQ